MKYLIPLLFFLSLDVYACKFGSFVSPFEITNEKATPPSLPNFTVHEIIRGKDGGRGSCSDAGFITLKDNLNHQGKVGFKFELHNSSFEDDLFYKKEALIPSSSKFIADGLYRFIWFDGLSDDQEAFDIVVKIVGVSQSGEESKPQFLRVVHNGTVKPWWKFW